MSASERRIAELEQQVADLEVKNRELQHLLKRQLGTGDTLWFESGISSRTGDPFVHIHWGDESGQLTADEARGHAMHMLECAHAAEFDSAFVKAITAGEPDGPGLTLDAAVGMLAVIRKQRTGGDTDASLATPRT